MPGNHSSITMGRLTTLYPGRLAWLMGPSNWKEPKSWFAYACDNDAFSAYTTGKEWSESAWLAMLERVAKVPQAPLWLLVPDKVADKEETLRRWTKYAPIVRDRGWKCAFAVQDGMTPVDVPFDADIVFVGGSTEWKWANIELWPREFARVHVGRVNSIRRVWQCQDLGVESVDGTGWFRDPSDPSKIPALIKWLDGVRPDETERLAA